MEGREQSPAPPPPPTPTPASSQAGKGLLCLVQVCFDPAPHLPSG